MKQTKIYFHRQISKLLILALVLTAFAPLTAEAAQITSRKVTLGTSQASISTSHNYQFTAPTATTILSADFTYCTTPSGACTTPTGLTTTTATLNGAPTNLGTAGTWTVGGAPTNGRIQISNATNTGAPSANATVNFNSVTNPSLAANNQNTFYIRVATYSAANWTGLLDSGVVAGTVTNQIQVTAQVDETLNFCAFQTGATCAAGTGTIVALGTLTSSAASGGTSKLVAGTNAASGYVIQYTGATLTCSTCSGAPTIAATGTTGATSTAGTAQFGINAVNNTTAPIQGANPAGGIGTASTNYATGNTYSFQASTLTQIAAATGSSADTVYTVSYLANIPSNQTAGPYSTTLTYICTATF